jgi:hypothetical protein
MHNAKCMNVIDEKSITFTVPTVQYYLSELETDLLCGTINAEGTDHAED